MSVVLGISNKSTVVFIFLALVLHRDFIFRLDLCESTSIAYHVTSMGLSAAAVGSLD